MRIDLHTHTSVSDGTDSPTRLVGKAAAQGLDVIALTDHDTFDGIREAQLAASEAGITVLSGIEMSCKLDGEDEAAFGPSETVITVPVDLVPKIRELIARRKI